MNRPEWSDEQRKAVEEGLTLARQEHAEIVELDGESVVSTILAFARQRGITQIFVGHRKNERWWDRAFGSDLDRLIRSAEGIDVRVFPNP
jgi:K+-sensing histidine kinase KdpD